MFWSVFSECISGIGRKFMMTARGGFGVRNLLGLAYVYLDEMRDNRAWLRRTDSLLGRPL